MSLLDTKNLSPRFLSLLTASIVAIANALLSLALNPAGSRRVPIRGEPGMRMPCHSLRREIAPKSWQVHDTDVPRGLSTRDIRPHGGGAVHKRRWERAAGAGPCRVDTTPRLPVG